MLKSIPKNRGFKSKFTALALAALLAAMSILASACAAKTGEKEGERRNTDAPAGETAKGGYSLLSSGGGRNARGKAVDEAFTQAHAGFMTELFKNALKRDENSLVSPLSVLTALAMTANGAKGGTLSEMQQTLSGGMSAGEVNEYLCYYLDQLVNDKNAKLGAANSIWFRQNEVAFDPAADGDPAFTVNMDFLDKNRDYYGADIFEALFDKSTVDAINSWTKEKTNGMIDRIIEDIDPYAVMELVNALTFEADWEEPYKYEHQLRDGEFTTSKGEKRAVKLMRSEEAAYLEAANAEGFIKPYKGGRFAFAALLPNEGVNIYDFIENLNGEGLLSVIKGARDRRVIASLPKFAFDFEASLADALKAMGMEDAFDVKKADFSGLGESAFGNILIGEVLHKTHIEVGEQGTRAAAVTRVEMMAGSAMPVEEPAVIVLDRPFVFMIMDTETNLPLFIGCAADIG